MSYSVPRSVLEALRQRPARPVLFYAGSFNPPHAGHVEAVKGAAQKVQELGHLEPPIVLVAPKSDERLRKKMDDYGESFMFPWLERVKLFQELWKQLGHGELHFDSGWRHFRGEALQIRMETDRAFGALGAKVFRVMGSDRVQDHGLEDDPWVLSTPRYQQLSSSQIRQLLGDPDALDALVGPTVAEAYMQSVETL